MNVRIIVSSENWIDGEAVAQLERAAALPGMIRAIGMPDLHPGKGYPIGAVFESQGIFYLHLAGNDVGCGMSLWTTDLPSGRLRLDRWEKNLSGLESRWEGDVAALLREEGLEPTSCDHALGTIGGGNHFVELQVLHEVHDENALSALGLQMDRLTLLVHSGSRGLGEMLFRDHLAKHGTSGLAERADEAVHYLKAHSHALQWAALNRSLIARRFLGSLKGEGRRVLDLCHNSITPMQSVGRVLWLQRKGAAPSDQGLIIIPGSRGTLSYLVEPIGEQEANAFSLPHGAGRKWNRSDARERLEARFKAKSLTRTVLGGRVICEDRGLLYEEAPQAYKNIDIVVKDLVDAALARVIATFRPVITYKEKNLS
jgi:release factor H-coupled RctB family protein